MAKAPWVVLDASTNEAVCGRCGERKVVPLPMPIAKFVRWSAAFSEMHADCQPTRLDPAELAETAAANR